MNPLHRILTIPCLVLMTQFSYALSLADVDHQIHITIAQISSLKAHQAADKEVRAPGIQVGKTTLHAYIKGLELLEKIQKYQLQNGLTAIPLPKLPVKRVRSANMLAIVQLAQAELSAINQSLNLQTANVVPNDFSKTASDLYENIWQASYMMDTLIEPIKPADVLRKVQMAEIALVDIAKKRNQQIALPALQRFNDKQSVDVTISLHKLLYKLAKLELKLKIKPLVVPAFPAGKIKPEDSFAAAGNVIADLTRIALKLKIAPVNRIAKNKADVSSNTVYAHLYRLNQSANLLLK